MDSALIEAHYCSESWMSKNKSATFIFGTTYLEHLCNIGILVTLLESGGQ